MTDAVDLTEGGSSDPVRVAFTEDRCIIKIVNGVRVDRCTEAEAEEVLELAETIDRAQGDDIWGLCCEDTLRRLVGDWRRLRGIIAEGIVEGGPGLYAVGANGIITEAREIVAEMERGVSG
jgi:hypothetical protein